MARHRCHCLFAVMIHSVLSAWIVRLFPVTIHCVLSAWILSFWDILSQLDPIAYWLFLAIGIDTGLRRNHLVLSLFWPLWR